MKEKENDLKEDSEESYPIKLARKTVETYIREGKVIEPPADSPDYLKKRAGAFVTLKKEGNLRGCIGTLSPVQKNLSEEIIKNAVHSSTEDPRFSPVTEDELDSLSYSVDVLNPPEKVIDKSELDPSKYGVIVKKGWRSGLLLPHLEGVDTVEEQLSIAKNKAGIDEDEEVEINRFTVTRYE